MVEVILEEVDVFNQFGQVVGRAKLHIDSELLLKLKAQIEADVEDQMGYARFAKKLKGYGIIHPKAKE